MNEQISLLIQLQEMDLELDGMTMEYESIPDKIEYHKNTLKESKNNIEQKRNELKQLQLEQKKLEIELSAKEEEIKKHRIELNSIKTNEQYKALLTEISNCEEAKDKFENEVIMMLEKIDKMNLSIKDYEKESKRMESDIGDKIKVLENKRSELEKEISSVKKNRDDFEKKLLPSVLKKYEHIRSSKDGTAIVPIINGACGNCHIKLPPQVINETTKVAAAAQSHELVYCENCSRILYIEIPDKLVATEGERSSEQ